MSAEPVVTGAGAIGAWGVERRALHGALAAGHPLARRVEGTPDAATVPAAACAALVPVLDLSPWLAPAHARRMAMTSRWSVAAARMAVEEARPGPRDGGRTAVVMATAFGSVWFTERLVRQVLDEGPQAAQPFYFSECVANAAAGQVAIAEGARGANVTIAQREAGPLIALSQAAAEVREERAEAALAGAVDEMSPLLHRLLDRYRALARGAAGRAEAPRPFDLRRDGVLAGEGAAVLLVEPAATARARGARTLARIRGTGSAFDPTATESDWGEGVETLAAALHRTLRRAGVAPEEIAGIVSGASGARRGDALEGKVLRSAWSGRTLPPIVAPKAVVGEYGGGILACALAALDGASFGRPTQLTEHDPQMGIDLHTGSIPHGPILVSALAAGGAAAWVVMDRP
ncbi:MAG TPA: beta-ketoacyl synthase N-terminal-like domain-containing protein [Candidatus Sulfotelmatobacter sp.]|jgi:3-oxoacyl-[acyl-carrier-protein] synthase II|nr:beta-ketoacyl synthase N-terminal-like domain-containing protein [Candidatus Sulfotelmatobacter sp.]